MWSLRIWATARWCTRFLTAAICSAPTPQAFRFATIRHAYELASQDPDFHPTDDTRVVVDYLPDTRVAIVAGSESNMKITTHDDLDMIKRFAFEATRQRAADRVHGMTSAPEVPDTSESGLTEHHCGAP